MIKSILLRHIAILSFCIIALNLQAQKDSIRSNYNLLWKIEGNGMTKPSYLFGTMHLMNKEVFSFSDSVLLALLESDVVALELNIDTMYYNLIESTLKQAETRYWYKQMFDESEYNIIKEQTKKYGINPDDLESKNIYDLDIKLSNLRKDKTEKMSAFLDAYLFYYSKNEGKNVVGLEKVEDQMNIHDSLSREKQKEIIFSKLKNIDNYLDYLNRMKALYYAGNLDSIWSYYNSFDDNYPIEVLNRRNHTMVKNLIPYLSNNSVFVAVGVAHLPGEQGLIKLLQDKGYTLTPVSAEFTGVGDFLIQKEIKWDWTEFIDSTEGMRIEVPVKPYILKLYNNIFEMKISYDAFNGPSYYFYAVPVTFSGYDNDSKIIYDQILERLRASRSFQFTSQRSIQFDGISGQELTAKYMSAYQCKIRIFYKNKMIYFLMVGNEKSHYTSSDADRFFNSLQMFKPNEIESDSISDWKEYKYPELAFSVKLPSQPNFKKIELPNYESIDESVSVSYLLTSIDANKQQLFLIRVDDMPPGFYVDDDSNMFQAMFGTIYGEDYVFDPKLESSYCTDEMKGYESVKRIEENGLEIRMRIFIRGNRFYSLLTQEKKGLNSPELDYFLNSFEVLKFQKPQLTSYNIEGLNIGLPSKPILIEESDGSNYFDDGVSSKTFSSTDPLSGSLISINVYQYPKYYKIENIDTMFENSRNSWDISEKKFDSINKGYTNDSFYFNSSNMVTPKNTLKFKFYQAIKNDKEFEIVMCGPKQFVSDSNFDKIIESINFDTYNKDFSLLSSKSKAIFKDLKSTDTIVFKEAKKALFYYKFDSTDLDLLHQAILIDYKDSSDYNSVISQLLYKFYSYNNDSTIHYLAKAYLLKKDIFDASYLLNAMSNLKGDYTETIFNLLKNDPPKNIMNYHGSNVLSSFEKNIKLYDQIKMDLFNMEFSENWTINCLASFVNIWDSLTFNDSELLKISGFAESIFNRYLDSLNNCDKNGYGYYSYYSPLSNCIKIFSKLNQPKYDDIVMEVSSSDLISFDYEILLYHISRGLKTSKSMWSDVLEGEYEAYDLIKELSQMKKLTLLPKKYYSEEQIGLIALNFFFMDYDEYVPENLTLFDTAHITIDSVSRIYYFYKFSYDDEDEQYMAVIGGISIEGEVLNDNYLYVDSNWDTFKTEEEGNELKLKFIDQIKKDKTTGFFDYYYE